MSRYPLPVSGCPMSDPGNGQRVTGNVPGADRVAPTEKG